MGWSLQGKPPRLPLHDSKSGSGQLGSSQGAARHGCAEFSTRPPSPCRHVGTAAVCGASDPEWCSVSRRCVRGCRLRGPFPRVIRDRVAELQTSTLVSLAYLQTNVWKAGHSSCVLWMCWSANNHNPPGVFERLTYYLAVNEDNQGPELAQVRDYHRRARWYKMGGLRRDRGC